MVKARRKRPAILKPDPDELFELTYCASIDSAQADLDLQESPMWSG